MDNWEEKQKDEILQQINDLLEKYAWGGTCRRMVVKVVFEGQFNVVSLYAHNDETKEKKT